MSYALHTRTYPTPILETTPFFAFGKGLVSYLSKSYPSGMQCVGGEHFRLQMCLYKYVTETGVNYYNKCVGGGMSICDVSILIKELFLFCA